MALASVTARTPTAPERLLLGPERRGAVCVDLGGYLTHSGEMVRWRAVLRWSAPCVADVADVFALAESVGGPLTLVDVARLAPAEALAAVSQAALPAVVYSTGAGAADGVHDVCALLLGVLGVGDDDIARDHALAGGDASAMRARLLDVRLGHGSMRGYAFDIGVDVAVVEQLRDRLLF